MMTPIGAVTGVDLSAAFASGTVASDVIRGSLTSFSAGIFIYVAFVEIIAEDFLHNHHHDEDDEKDDKDDNGERGRGARKRMSKEK